MSVVAIAGGTSSIGRAVLEGIQERGTHTAIVLSRNVHYPLDKVVKYTDLIRCTVV